MIISYSSQAKEALDLMANFDRGAYTLALLRIQGWMATIGGDGMTEGTLRFTVDNETYVVSIAASVIGVEYTVHELGWEAAGI